MIKEFEVGKVYSYGGETSRYLVIGKGPAPGADWRMAFLVRVRSSYAYTQRLGEITPYRYRDDYLKTWEEKE